MIVRNLAAAAALILATVVPRASGACPDQPECLCDCGKDCPCGETIVTTKVCKLIKHCWGGKRCSNEKKAGKCGASKQAVCHIPPGNPANAHTICIGTPAVVAHLQHGDYLGKCLECDDHCSVKKCCKWEKEKVCRSCSPDCPPCVCGKDAGPRPDSSPVVPDSSPVIPDSSPVIPDSSPVIPDSSPVIPDSSPVIPDSSPVVPDSSPVVPDSSPVVPDSSPVLPDAAPQAPDAGPADAAFQPPDAGPPPADLEVITPDGPCDCPDGFQEEGKDQRGMELAGGGFGCSVGDGAGSSAVAFLLVGLLVLLIRRRRTAAVGCLCLLLMASSAVRAEPDFPGPKFQPSTGEGNYIQTTGTDVLKHKRISLGVFYNYSHRPVQLLWSDTGSRVTNVIQYRHNADVLFAIGIKNRIELGLAVPFVAAQDTVAMDPLGGRDPNYLTGGLGDIRLSMKAHMLKKGPFSMGAFGILTLPTATEPELFGNGLGFAPALAGGLDLGRVAFGANIGVNLAAPSSYDFQSQEIASGPELFGSLAGRLMLWKAADASPSFLRQLDFLADGFISMGLQQHNEEEVPFEILSGLRAKLPWGLSVDAGAGPGITHGVGTPTYRVYAGLTWTPEPETRTVVKHEPCEECDRPVITRRTTILMARTRLSISKLHLDPVYFDTDKQELLPQSVPILRKNLELLKESQWVKKVRIEGHADWRASDEYNLALGMRRATTVGNFLIKGGVRPGRLILTTSGEAKPYASNRTSDGMSQNRRVEFLILDPKTGRFVTHLTTINVIKR